LPAVPSIGPILGRIGESDCEELGGGFLVQPSNALTSLAYVAVGLVVAIVASRRVSRPLESYVYAVGVAAVGLGSVAFHGPQPAGSRVMHDLPILVTAIFILCYDLRLLTPRVPSVLGVFAGGAVAATALTLVSVDAGAVATGIVLVAVGAAETVIHRRHLRSERGTDQRVLTWAIIGVALLAGASWLLGRTGSPVCDPDGMLQFHGVWHVVSALVFGLWWWLAIGSGAAIGRAGPPPHGVDSAL
jgi:hypothetical protein